MAAPVASVFSDTSVVAALTELKKLMANPEDVRHVPRVLANSGIRFVVIKPLASGKIDGVVLWLDENSPVIAMSLRYDRIDNFWFVLMHEMAHVSNRDGLTGEQPPDVFENGRIPSDLPANERRANDVAAEFAIAGQEIDSFVARVGPLYSRLRIVAFAKRWHIHPGIVVGQLQGREKIPYTHHRSLLAPIREFVVASALSDGWGQTAPLG